MAGYELNDGNWRVCARRVRPVTRLAPVIERTQHVAERQHRKHAPVFGPQPLSGPRERAAGAVGAR